MDHISKIILSLTQKQKKSIIFFHDLLIALVTLPIAFLIRTLDTPFDKFATQDYATIFIIAFLTKIISIQIFKLHRGIWSFSSIIDLIQILKATTLAVSSYTLFLFTAGLSSQIPRSVPLIDWLLFMFFLGLGRLSFRVLKETRLKRTGDKTLVIGAGRAGEQIIRELRNNKSFQMSIVGFLDDDPTKKNRSIHGVPVLGNINNAESILNKYKVENIIIAIPSADNNLIRRILAKVEFLNIKIQTLPSFADIAEGKVNISQLRPVNVEDLLGRKPINLDDTLVNQLLKDRVILVTGAGGSIGSDLSLQILKRKPKKLILFEICEYFLYRVEIELRESYPDLEVIPIIGDVRDKSRVFEVFNQYKPEVVFHAAAYKHVPMMELNPIEAIKTNVVGTSIVTEASGANNVSSFVLISTDKAVKPTNIMGASKRIAELQIQKFQKMYPETKFGTVRFGNVLGSNGSVIPRFMKQIKSGGPVTVTHPEITRYFMSIPEATQLVLQAGAMTSGGEVFVLDMGKPVKIIDLAKDLVRLCGLKVNDDIKIKFTGLRPAEKLFEELIFNEEETLITPHPLLRIVKKDYSLDLNTENDITNFLDTFKDSKSIRKMVKNIVKEYSYEI